MTAHPLAAARLAAQTARDLKARNASDSSVGEAFEAAVVANPNDRLLLADWMDVLLKTSDTPAIVERLAAIQAGSVAPIRSILLALRDLVGLRALHARLPERLALIRDSEAIATVAAAWRHHLHGEAPSAELCAGLLNGPSFSTELYFAIFATPVRQVSLRKESADADAVLSAAGIEPGRMRSYAQAFADRPNEAIERRILATYPADMPRSRMALAREQPGLYKFEIIRDGSLAVLDPYSGEAVQAIDSVRMFGRTIYTFYGARLFYLICGNMGNDALGLYCPQDGVSLSFLSGGTSLLSGPNLVSIQAQLITRVCRKPQLFAAACERGGPASPRKVVLHLEKTENLAHHLWNFYSCVDHLIATGLAGHVSRLQFSGAEFFGPLADIFPELGRTGFERPRVSNIADPCPFSQEEILVGAGSMFMARTLPERIIAAMRRLPRGADPVPDDFAPLPFPVVWLGMRLGDKSWVDQETELPKLIGIIAADHPSALFLLDGFSSPVGGSAVREHWTPVRDRLAAIAAAVKAASPRPERVVNMVGNTLRENVLWAAVTDVYLAPMGTTQHKVAWFTDAPGIAYAPPSSRDTAGRSPAAWAAEISPTPHWVFGEPAGAGERRGVSRNREKLVNVRLDTEAIARQMLELIAARPKRTPEPSA